MRERRAGALENGDKRGKKETNPTDRLVLGVFWGLLLLLNSPGLGFELRNFLETSRALRCLTLNLTAKSKASWWRRG